MFKISDYFTLEKVERFKEAQTKVYFYKHNKTQAKILFFDTPNENATFGTFFRTPAENSKGTTHILEHSVFEGSKKYPLENSLDFIQNNSLASFFNAFTFPDKTGYFFCTSFEKDYLNNLDIFLDFVYFPLLEEKTLRKEGHFFKKTKDSYEFNGIVFNEMKDSLLTFNSQMFESVSHLFENGTYEFNSGGDPLYIVDLTHNELKNYHERHYHPSNSYTILYGKINKNKVFSKLNEVFSQFEKSNHNVEIIATPIKENKKIRVAYQGSSDINFCKYYLFEGIKSEEDFIYLYNSINYLLGYSFSPLRRVIEDSNLCSALDKTYLTDIKHPVLIISCKNVKEEDIEKLEKLIDENLNKYIKNVSSEVKELLLKRSEFKFNEIEFYKNQGKDVMLSAVNFLNYDLDPLIGMRFFKTLSKIKKALTGKNLDKFMQDKYSKVKTVSAIFYPDKNLLTEYTSKIQEKLNNNLSSMDFKLLDEEIKKHEEFLNRTKKEPNYKNLKKITEKDLKLEVKRFETSHKDSILTTYLNSGEIVRAVFNFDISSLEVSKYPMLGIYISLIGKISSKNYKFDKLSFIKRKLFDHISLNTSVLYNHHNEKQYSVFYINTKLLKSDIKEATNIIKEIITNINFNDKERIKFLLNEQLEFIKEDFQEKALNCAMQISDSYLSTDGYIDYQLNSIPYKNELKRILNNFDTNYGELVKDLENIHKLIFSSKCFIHLGISKEIEEEILRYTLDFSNDLKFKLANIKDFDVLEDKFFKPLDKNINLFYETPSDTTYNIMSVKYPKFNKEQRPVIGILGPYMHQYLWDNIRIKNGAYGSHWYLNKDYSLGTFCSFSDPKIIETYHVYSKTKNNYDITKFKKYSFNKMKLKFLAGEKLIYRNSDIFNITFNLFLKDTTYSEREHNLMRRLKLDFDEFKSLFNSINKFERVVKVVATTKENISKFNEKYEIIDLN